MKAFLIGGTSSGSGKTTITLGLLRAYARRGMRIQPFKVGPDYIDTGWHTHVTGVASRNLDAFMLPESVLSGLFQHHADRAELSVIEGVMGLYDGYGTDPHYCSSAGVARQLGCPVILVIDGKAVSTSAAATVLGFSHFDPTLNIAGVILNRVNSEEHYALLKQAIERHCQIPVLGRLPVISEIELPSRHLGLVTAHENQLPGDQWERLVDHIEQHIDLDRLLQLADVQPEVSSPCMPFIPEQIRNAGQGLILALAEDEAFNFYYPDNLDLLAAAGVSIVRFSPVHDSQLPECDLIYLGGGYPELHAQALASNIAMRNALLAAHQRGVAIYAECGGLMYLGSRLITASGEAFPMVGIFQGESHMTTALKRFGYCEATALHDTLLAKAGETLRGHEFHYSDFDTKLATAFSFSKTRDSQELKCWQGGYQTGNSLASYLHVHFGQNPAMLLNWFSRGRAKA